MAARRAKADHVAEQLIAEMRHNKYEVQDCDIEYILSVWGFDTNHSRTSVMPSGTTWVHSDTLGMIRYRNTAVELAPPSVDYPFVTMALVAWMRGKIDFDFPCTSISVNKNYAGKIHRDAFNAGPSALLALGDLRGPAWLLARRRSCYR